MEYGGHRAVFAATHAVLQVGAVDVDAERCKGCGLCVDECPAQTLRLSEGLNKRGFNHSEQAHPERCIGCASCALICPDACITVYRRSRIPDALQRVKAPAGQASDAADDAGNGKAGEAAGGKEERP